MHAQKESGGLAKNNNNKFRTAQPKATPGKNLLFLFFYTHQEKLKLTPLSCNANSSENS